MHFTSRPRTSPVNRAPERLQLGHRGGRRIRNCLHVGSISLLFVFLAGCGQGNDGAAAGQVVAKVNSDEITVHQINHLIARRPDLSPELAEHARREILEKLIDQDLAVQQAIANKLDRAPEVVLAIDAAKREILARAYFQRVAALQLAPSQKEIRNYYMDHPELFAKRRLYNLVEISVSSGHGVTQATLGRAAKRGTMEKLADWLKTQNIKYATRRAVRAPEQLPLELLPTLQAMKDGDIRVFEGRSGRFEVVQVVTTKSAPIDETRAAPLIEKFLSNKRAKEAIAQEMKRLRRQAQIQYFGEFSTGARSAEGKPVPPPKTVQ